MTRMQSNRLATLMFYRYFSPLYSHYFSLFYLFTLQTLVGHAGAVLSLFYSKGQLLSCGTDGRIILWENRLGRSLLLYPWFVPVQSIRAGTAGKRYPTSVAMLSKADKHVFFVGDSRGCISTFESRTYFKPYRAAGATLSASYGGASSSSSSSGSSGSGSGSGNGSGANRSQLHFRGPSLTRVPVMSSATAAGVDIQQLLAQQHQQEQQQLLQHQRLKEQQISANNRRRNRLAAKSDQKSRSPSPTPNTPSSTSSSSTSVSASSSSSAAAAAAGGGGRARSPSPSGHRSTSANPSHKHSLHLSNTINTHAQVHPKSLSSLPSASNITDVVAVTRFEPLAAPQRVHRLGLSHLLLVPDDQLCISISFDHSVKVHDPLTGAGLFAVENPANCRFTALCWDSEFKDLVLGDAHGTIHLWSVFDEVCVKQVRTGPLPILHLSAHAGGKLIVTTAAGTSLWQISRTRGLISCRGHTAPIVGVSYAGLKVEDLAIYSAALDNETRLWDPLETHCLAMIVERKSELSCLLHLPFSVLLASGLEDGSVVLSSTETGASMRVTHHRDSVTALTYVYGWGGEMSYLVSSSYDGTLAFWGASPARPFSSVPEFCVVASNYEILCLASASSRFVAGWNSILPGNVPVTTLPSTWLTAMNVLSATATVTATAKPTASASESASTPASGGGMSLAPSSSSSSSSPSLSLSPPLSLNTSDSGSSSSQANNSTGVTNSSLSSEPPSALYVESKVSLVPAVTPPFSDAYLVASGGNDGVVRVWCAKTRQCVAELYPSNSDEDGLSAKATAAAGLASENAVVCVDVDGYVVVAGLEDATVRAWDTMSQVCASDIVTDVVPRLCYAMLCYCQAAR